MTARVEMKFVRNFSRGKHAVERRRSGFKTEIVVVAAIEINPKICERCRLREHKRRIAFPKGRIGRDSERISEDSCSGGVGRAAKKVRKLFDQRSAVRADRGEKFRMAEREMHRAVTAHGSTGNGAIRASRLDAKFLFDSRQKFPHEKIFIANFSVV